MYRTIHGRRLARHKYHYLDYRPEEGLKSPTFGDLQVKLSDLSIGARVSLGDQSNGPQVPFRLSVSP